MSMLEHEYFLFYKNQLIQLVDNEGDIQPKLKEKKNYIKYRVKKYNHQAFQ